MTSRIGFEMYAHACISLASIKSQSHEMASRTNETIVIITKTLGKQYIGLNTECSNNFRIIH